MYRVKQNDNHNNNDNVTKNKVNTPSLSLKRMHSGRWPAHATSASFSFLWVKLIRLKVVVKYFFKCMMYFKLTPP